MWNLQGGCAVGGACRFAHSAAELQDAMSLQQAAMARPQATMPRGDASASSGDGSSPVEVPAQQGHCRRGSQRLAAVLDRAGVPTAPSPDLSACDGLPAQVPPAGSMPAPARDWLEPLASEGCDDGAAEVPPTLPSAFASALAAL